MRIARRPRFVDDLSESYAAIAPYSPEAAERLIDQVDALVQLLASFPELGRARDDLRPGVRSFRVRPFKHVLFYHAAPGQIVLLRLLHGAQDLSAKQYED